MASNALCGSRPTRVEVCRPPLASLVDSPDPLEVRRGEGVEAEKERDRGRERLSTVRAVYEREGKSERG